MQQIGSLPVRRQCFKSCFQGGASIQLPLPFFRDGKFARQLENDLQTGFFHFNGLRNIGFQNAFLCHDLRHRGKTYLASRLGIFTRADQQTVDVLQHRAFEKHQRAVFLEQLDDGDTISYATLLSALSPAEQVLGRPINPTPYTVAEFRKRQQEQQHFLMRVLEQPKLFLIGYEDDLRRLGEPGQDPQAQG